MSENTKWRGGESELEANNGKGLGPALVRFIKGQKSLAKQQKV